MNSDPEQDFDAALTDVCRRAALEANYNTADYSLLHQEHTGLETAKLLLHAASVSRDYTALCNLGRLDLTVEAIVHGFPESNVLFSPEEREIARRRLESCNYPPLIDPVEEFIGAFASDVPDWASHHDKYLGQTLMDDHLEQPGSRD